MKITLEVSEKNESSVAPWWVIIEPKQNMSLDIFQSASQVTGPFFSRESAQEFLTSARHDFSKRAVVFCMSGCYSKQYCDAIKQGELS